jgi:signal transduction histidine kinase
MPSSLPNGTTAPEWRQVPYPGRGFSTRYRDGVPALTPWQAVRTRPRRLLASALPARALAYLLSGVPVGVLLLATLPVLLGAGLAGVPFGALERWRLRLLDRAPAPGPHRPPARPGLRAWLVTRLREAATWQELAFAVLTAVLLWPLDLMVVTFAVALSGGTLLAPLLVALAPAGAVPNGARLGPAVWLLPLLGVPVTVAMAYLVTAVAAARAALVRAVLAAPAEHERLVELTRSRSRLVEGFDDERRRIERDLHDGVQQRLLALSVGLGLARLELAEGGSPVALVTEAHTESQAILAELRRLVRGIHPWLLTDRGLGPALAELAGRCAVPVRTDVDLPARFAPVVESTAYFVVSEALANVDRHSAASQATVTARYARGVLTVDVRDDGRGGADPARGTGLRGLADRAEAAGARLLVASPPGGPTLLRLEIPCPTRNG